MCGLDMIVVTPASNLPPISQASGVTAVIGVNCSLLVDESWAGSIAQVPFLEHAIISP